MLFGKYNRIDTIEKLAALDAYLSKADGTPKYDLIAVDTETNGLQLHKSTIVGFSLSLDRWTGFYIPLLDWIPDPKSFKKRKMDGVEYGCYMDGHLQCVWTGKKYPEFVTPKEYEAPEFIAPLMEKWFLQANLIMHNAPFDVNMIYVCFGVDLKYSLFVDTSLISHIINENSSNALKKVAEEFKDKLGFNPHAAANIEQQELKRSIIENGGSKSAGEVWRASPDFMCKYACADTFLTYGVYEVLMEELIAKFGEKGIKWVFEDEVMPVCKEVTIDMKRRGVYVDVPYFQALQVETIDKMRALEDKIIQQINPLLDSFTLGKSVDDAISKQRIIRKIAELEGLAIPVKVDKKTGEAKETLAKGEVEKEYAKNPHWLWGYILGTDEIKYSDAKMDKIKADLYEEHVGRRYRFNIGSDAHLRWLFCDKLGMSRSELPQTDSATKDNPIPSVAAEVLQEHMLPKFPWVQYLLTYKRLSKMQSTYISPAVELNIDGWLYMDMKQNGTVSGRFACSGGFNLQTLPRVEEFEVCPKCESKKLRVESTIHLLANVHCEDCGHVQEDQLCPSAIKLGFIAPPGYKIVNADYSSLEPRCFAYQSGDNKLKEVYWNDLDLYSKVYCDMFDEKKQYSAHPAEKNFLKKQNKAARTMVKPIVLGIPYGARKCQVANLLNKKKTYTDKQGNLVETLDIEYGQYIIDTYLNTYPELRKYMLKMETQCLTQGYVETMFGRRRHFEYAPVIYKYLSQMPGFDVDEFMEVSGKKLVGPHVEWTTSTGHKLTLTKELLKIIAKECGLREEDVYQKEGWKYLRNCMKADLNNAKNFPIQGVAGHICNKGMLDTTRLYKANNLEAWVCLQVHDEISCYSRDEHSEAASQCLQVGMEKNEFAMAIDVPMIAEPLIAENLRDAK